VSIMPNNTNQRQVKYILIAGDELLQGYIFTKHKINNHGKKVGKEIMGRFKSCP